MKCLICKVNTNKYACFYNLFFQKELCCKCYEKFQYNPQVIKYKKHTITILFKYNDIFRRLVYLWKIDKDKNANAILANLMKKYFDKNKTIIYPPSFSEPSLKRLFTYLKFKNKNIFLKNKNDEQKTKGYFYRVANFELVKKIPDNFLLIDDIYTSGTTIKKSLDLIEKQGYKSVEAIIFATTQDFNNQK